MTATVQICKGVPLQSAPSAPILLDVETRLRAGGKWVNWVTDPVVPIELLLSANSQQILDVLVSEVGASVVESEVSQVRYVPNRLLVVQYKVSVNWGSAKTTETFVASSGLDVPADVPQLDVEGTLISVWRYPRDPFLPAWEPQPTPTK